MPVLLQHQVRVHTIVRETVVRETVVRETVVRDTVVRDTVVRDTVVTDIVVSDTVVSDTTKLLFSALFLSACHSRCSFAHALPLTIARAPFLTHVSSPLLDVTLLLLLTVSPSAAVAKRGKKRGKEDEDEDEEEQAVGKETYEDEEELFREGPYRGSRREAARHRVPKMLNLKQNMLKARIAVEAAEAARAHTASLSVGTKQ